MLFTVSCTTRRFVVAGCQGCLCMTWKHVTWGLSFQLCSDTWRRGMECQTAVTAETTVQLCDIYGRPYTDSDWGWSVQLLHTVQQIAALLQQFGWECLELLPYGPNLAQSDFYLFSLSEEASWCSQFPKWCWSWGSCLTVVLLAKHSLITCYDKCLNIQGDYVEK